MHINKVGYQKVKNKYLKFIKSQEVLSEPFRNKIGQLNNFYLPLSKMINDNYHSSSTLSCFVKISDFS